MSKKTIDLLFDNIINDTIQDLHPAVICDYFGFKNIKYDDNIDIIYSIYNGLIKIKGISKKLIENCFFTNRLDELIHKKHIHHKSKYYQMFCDKKIQIGKTFNNKNIVDIQEIYDDNHCPSCNIDNYIDNKVSPPDCSKCLNNICKMCSIYCKIEYNYICYKCNNPSLEKSIKNKISGYKKQDKDKFGFEGNILFEDVKELLLKQKFKCYVCDDMVITTGWKPNCLYQFTLDRINNSLPHNRDNCLISCYYCNCKDIMLSFTENIIDIDNIKNKICKNKCHNVKRYITLNKNNISNDKINELKLY